MLYLALSCLQGRPMNAALDELLALGPDGVQLTPGNQPTPHFAQRVHGLRVRTHHGFSFTQWKQAVWRGDGPCAVQSDSVHPPLEANAPAFHQALEHPHPTLETMYPGYHLGRGEHLDALMSRGEPLAVDVSHVFLQREAGVLTEGTWKRLQDYPRVVEVHVSRNDGCRDAHLPVTPDTFGLAWALARLRAGTPVILESYFHRLGADARRQQCAVFDEVR
jgi:hypothetical protein